MTPAVSILMPVRNGAPFLPATLASLLRQSCRDWELVAVDDRSDDATPAILADAARRDSRVRVLRSDPPGLVGALNSGLAACRAPLVARMDGDDIAHPRRLELQAAFLAAHPAIALVASRFRHFPRHHLRKGMLAYEAWQNSLLSHDEIMRDLFVESPFAHPSVMFRRDPVQSLGGYRSCPWAEDYDLWLRIAAAGGKFARLPETLLYWRERPDRATRTLAEYRAEAFRSCKVHYLRQMFLGEEREVVLAGAGVEGRAWRRALAEAGVGVGLWLDVDPRKSGRMLHGAEIRHPSAYRPDSRKMLVTIGTPQGRISGRNWALGIGLREWGDFLCVT